MKTITGQNAIWQAENIGFVVSGIVKTPPNDRGHTFPTTGEISDSDYVTFQLFLDGQRKKYIEKQKKVKTQRIARIYRAQDKCGRRRPVTDDNPAGGHQVEAVSHEEEKCVDCGAYFFVPDM